MPVIWNRVLTYECFGQHLANALRIYAEILLGTLYYRHILGHEKVSGRVRLQDVDWRGKGDAGSFQVESVDTTAKGVSWR